MSRYRAIVMTMLLASLCCLAGCSRRYIVQCTIIDGDETINERFELPYADATDGLAFIEARLHDQTAPSLREIRLHATIVSTIWKRSDEARHARWNGARADLLSATQEAPDLEGIIAARERIGRATEVIRSLADTGPHDLQQSAASLLGILESSPADWMAYCEHIRHFLQTQQASPTQGDEAGGPDGVGS